MNSNNNGHFSQGFVLGAIVGGMAVFLLGTKKGNKILKTLTEDGFDGLTTLIEELENTQKGVSPKPKEVKNKVGPKPEEVQEFVLEDEKEEVPLTNGNGHQHRRFFKRK